MAGDKGNTKLHDMAENGDLKGIITDIAKGAANTSAKNDEGKTAAEVATSPIVAAVINSPSSESGVLVAPSFVQQVTAQKKGFSMAEFNAFSHSKV